MIGYVAPSDSHLFNQSAPQVCRFEHFSDIFIHQIGLSQYQNIANTLFRLVRGPAMPCTCKVQSESLHGSLVENLRFIRG